MPKNRKSGILLHITSLPSEFGIGDLGPKAYEFADILKKSRQSFWEILPINPTSYLKGNSPYAASSAFAGNTLLISPQLLYKDGFLRKNDLEKIKNIFNNDALIKYVDYKKVINEKNKIFQKAYENFKSIKNKYQDDFYNFCLENDQKWLNGFAFFKVIKSKLSKISWSSWPDELKNLGSNVFFIIQNKPEFDLGIIKFDFNIYKEIEKEKFLQFIFFRQWFNLKNYCNYSGIKIIGDIPIYVDFESSDVWTNPDIFKLDKEKIPEFVSGVPPDYFSKSGQLWKNPVYNWENLKKNKYNWWVKRIEHNLNLFDFVRIDHFRGFVAFWEVSVKDKTAKNGRWVRAYPEDFFLILKKKLYDKFNKLPIIAENLGYITPDVEEIMKDNGFPGLRVILFAFGRDFPGGINLPHNYDKNCVAYTGTHDNNTIAGWFSREAGKSEKENLSRYLGKDLILNSINEDLIRLVMSSAANLSIIPIQDILGLDEKTRMNRPSTSRGNWKWRMSGSDMSLVKFDKITEFTETYSRI